VGKKSKQVLEDLYDCSTVDELDSLEDVISSNRLAKRLAQNVKKLEFINKKDPKMKKPSESANKTSVYMSQIEVHAKCNNCGKQMTGKLLDYFYQPDAKIVIPFIEYTCCHCGKHGKRAVNSAALSPHDFDMKYFN
jgi:hypothetical protein